MNSTRGLVADVVPSSCVDGPGNRYVVFLQGCTFNCLGCHNPHTIPRRETGGSRWIGVEELIVDITADAPFLSGVTVSGGEATMQWEFVRELFTRLASRPTTSHLSRLVDSNGDADLLVWDALATTMSGAMIDLKALDPEVHRFLTRRSNDRVLASIRHLDLIDRLAEVRLLLIPGVNDSLDQLHRTARWLSGLHTAPTIAVLGFRHHGTRRVARAFADATDSDLERAISVLVGAGIGSDRIRTPPRLGADIGVGAGSQAVPTCSAYGVTH